MPYKDPVKDRIATWQTWTNTSATTTEATGDPWITWTTSASTSVTDTTWAYWANHSGTTSGSYRLHDRTYLPTRWASSPMMTPEYIAAYNAEQERLRVEHARQAAVNQAQYEAGQAARMEKLAAANGRAETLLLEHLTEDQERPWREERAIFVTGQSGKRYKIKEGRFHNLYELDGDGKPITELCVHVEANCPDADNVLAQKFALECNEAVLLQRANKWDLSGGGRHRL